MLIRLTEHYILLIRVTFRHIYIITRGLPVDLLVRLLAIYCGHINPQSTSLAI